MRINGLKILKTPQSYICRGIPKYEVRINAASGGETPYTLGFGYYDTVDKILDVAESNNWVVIFDHSIPIEDGLIKLWKKLEDIPVDENGEYIEVPFNGFEVGTEITEIWRWFEEQRPGPWKEIC